MSEHHDPNIPIHRFFTPDGVNVAAHRRSAQKSADAGKTVEWHLHGVNDQCNENCGRIEPFDED